MKYLKTIPYIIIIALTFSCNTIQAQAPKAVQSAFENKYPGENDPDWEKDSNGNYEAHFKQKGEKYRADFSPNGQWIETESSISKGDLPKAIKTVIKDKYKDETITEIEYVTSASKGTFYDVEFKRKGKNKDVEFRANGNIIN